MVSLTHRTKSPPGAVDAGGGRLSKNAWDEEHDLSMAANAVLGRLQTDGAGAAREVTTQELATALLPLIAPGLPIPDAVGIALAAKADVSSLAAKADALAVTNALAGKQNTSAILAALAALDATPGTLVQTGASTFAKRGETSFATRAALVAATIAASVGLVTVAGYAAAGDGGHAHYRRDPVANLSNPWVVQSADGAKWSLAEPVINPRMLGATGGADDSTPINNALSYLGSLTYGGVLRIDEAFTAGALQIGAKTVVTGSGKITNPAGSSAATFKFNGANSVLEYIEIVGAANPGTPGVDGNNAVVIRNAAGCVVRKCHIHGHGNAGIQVSEGADGVFIAENDIHDNRGIGIFALPALNANVANLSITANKVRLNWQHGIVMANGPGFGIVDTAAIMGNLVNNNGYNPNNNTLGGGAIWCQINSSNIIIAQNHCFANNGDQISTQGGGHITVSGNISHDATGPVGDDQNSGIVAGDFGATMLTITGNICFGNSAMGITVNSQGGGTSMVAITGNIVFNNGKFSNTWSGISAFPGGSGAMAHIAVTGNVVHGNNWQKWGIDLSLVQSGVCTGNYVTGNVQTKQINFPLNLGAAFHMSGNSGWHPGDVSSFNPPASVAAGTNTVSNPFPFPCVVYLNCASSGIGQVIVNNSVQAFNNAGAPISRFMVMIGPGEPIGITCTATVTLAWQGMQ